MNKLFTIIIPTFNRASLLQKAIQSIIGQTYTHWEVIVVDDGSTDETKEIVNGFEEERIKYIYQENKERSAARNAGIEKAEGDYICFLDDDDYFLNNHLEVIQERILKEKYPIAIFRTGMIVKSENHEVRSPFYNRKKDNHPIDFFLKNMVGIHTLCYHRSIFQSYQYDERWYHFQDTHLLILCLLKFPFYQILEHTAVYMRYPEMGSLSIFRSEKAEVRTENNVNAIKDLFDQGGTELLKYVSVDMENYLVAQKYIDHAGGVLRVGKKKLARKYIRKSLAYEKIKLLFMEYMKFMVRYFLALFK